MQADHHRLSRLWHRFIQQTHASDSSCVTKAEWIFHFTHRVSQRRTWNSQLHQRKKAGGGAMFDPCASVQSIICVRHGEPDRRRARFSKVDGDFLAKNRKWVGPSGNQENNFELSSCLETTCQIRVSTLSWRRWRRARIGPLSELASFVEARRQDATPCQKSSILDWGIRVAISACCSWPPQSEYHQRWRLYGCESDLDAFSWSTLPRKVRCKPRNKRGGLGEDVLLVFSEARLHEPNQSWHKPPGSSWHAISDCIPGWGTWRLLISSFKF